jgi:PAS domain S-box-containing protein
MGLALAQQFFENVEPRVHLVQLYEADEQVLANNVSHYLWEGLKRQEGLLIVATPKHRDAFARRLRMFGADLDSAVHKGQLIFLDADQTLAKFMVDGTPDWSRFRNVIGAVTREIQEWTGRGEIRAYGEMVGLLWQAGQFTAALQLEELWHRLLDAGDLRLFCAYPIDVFAEEFHAAAVKDILCAHTHLVPTGKNGDVESALIRAMDDILGPEADRFRVHTNGNSRPAGTVLPKAEAAILSLRSNIPAAADEVLIRARQYYQSDKRFRSLIENSSDAISLMDARGKVLYASASTTKVLGYEPGELLGRNGFELFHPDDAEQAWRTHREALAKPGAPVRLHARMLRKDGRWCWVESTSSNLLDERDVRAIVTNYRDVSERKLAEEKKQRDAENLARNNAELEAFAFAVAHDLKEPLRTVCAFTQLLVQSTELDGKPKEYAGIIVDGVCRMSALLDDLLSFTRLNFSEPLDRVELQHAADQAVKNLEQAIAESRAAVTIDPLPAVAGRQSYLVELFQNLIANAIKYRSPAPIEIRITAERRGRQWAVKVKDNGIGIAPEHHEQIFGLFKRLHGHEIAGTGIGLAICKKIVEGMGGKLWVRSEPGKGSTFCFTVQEVEN